MVRLRAFGQSSAAVVLLTLLIYGGFTTLRLARAGGDWSIFICCGDQFCDPAAVPAGVRVLPDSAGYDGQFGFRLALDPLTRRAEDFGIRIDIPPYRQQRILYPLIVHAVTLGGRPEWVPPALVLVNIAGLLVMAGAAAQLARQSGRAALWALPLVLFPGYLLTLARDLNEIVAAALLVYALCCWEARRVAAAGGLMGLAVLARETSIVVPLVLAIGVFFEPREVRPGERMRRAGWVVLPALATLLIWQLVLQQTWGHLPLRTGGGNLGWPLLGLWGFLEPLTRSGTGRRAFAVHGLFLALLGVLLVVLLLRGRENRLDYRLAAGAHLLIALCATRAVWESPWSAVRTLSELAVLGWLLSLRAEASWPRRVAAGALPVYWLIVAAALVRRVPA